MSSARIHLRNLAFNGEGHASTSLVMFFVAALFVLLFGPTVAWCAVNPSQVLVLYNADWTEDAFLTDPGQDSKEIAEHYVRMHTDPKTAEKPYILGLSCRHGIKIIDEDRHLNETHLAENSSDNKAGVELIKRRWLVGSDIRDDELRDSRLVEFTLPGGPEGWKRETLQLTIDPDDRSKITVIKNGLIKTVGKVAGNPGKEWTVRLDAGAFVRGGLTVRASCESSDGKRSDWEARYVDVDNVKFSRTGRDGVRDDQDFLEDVELPVKAFLEDPKNARSDGTLLKDHILFIVVSYGLPRTAVATYGIARGITDKLNNFGSIIDFGQRLQLLYYDEEKVMGTTPKPMRFAGKGPFTSFFIRAPQASPLFGVDANPFVHPLVYQKKKGSLDDLPEPLEFTPQNRKKYAERHLYFVSRIDAPDPLQARGLIDRAVYASKYAGPDMGRVAGGEYSKSKERVGKLDGSATGKWLWNKGWRHLNYGGQASDRLELFHLPSETPFLNTEPVYLPGGVGGTVISHNGWKKGEMVGDLARGVTATVGAAQVYKGAPHIHNKSWWDDGILYPSLLKGRTLGEALLMNQVHLGWIATFVGDPLYRLPQIVERQDGVAPFDKKQELPIHLIRNQAGDKEVWLRVDLGSTAARPVVGQLKVISPEGNEMVCPTFEARPYVRLGSVKDACGKRWKIEMIDPYGQRSFDEILVECADR